MLARVAAATISGVEGRAVTVEVHVGPGLPGFTVVGCPDRTVRESRDRVRAALLSSGLAWPNRRVTVNLAPAGTPKSGSGLDLALAVALAVADGSVPDAATAGTAFLGELGLDGSLRAVPGLVPMAGCLDRKVVVVPAPGAAQAALVLGGRVRPAATLGEVVAALTGRGRWRTWTAGHVPATEVVPDLAEVRGQAVARRALEVAAAGGHHLLLLGPPGCGKTMLARRLPGILPPLDAAAGLDVARIHSAAGLPVGPSLPSRPPFRSPHPTVTEVGLLGGGPAIRPGEVSLAHRGVLFLDELGEMRPSVLDALRQPLEEGCVRLARGGAVGVLPARFLLVGAMNPCRCAAAGEPGRCRCGPSVRLRRLSAPVLDRFGLRITLAPVEADVLVGGASGVPSAVVAGRVRRARARAASRGTSCNAAIPDARLDELAPLGPAAARLVRDRLTAGALSARGLAALRRVARTLADLEDGHLVLDERDVAEALALRSEDTPGEL